MRITAEYRNHLKVEGHKGTWYVVDETNHNDQQVYLLEHEKYGEDVACLIVDKDLNVLVDDVWNGFDDLEYL